MAAGRQRRPASPPPRTRRSNIRPQLTGNDTDADPTRLTITGVSNFVNGTASVTGGVVTFTPTANFNGTASFDYTISDGNGHTDTATATVTVGAVNDPVGTDRAGDGDPERGRRRLRRHRNVDRRRRLGAGARRASTR